MDCNKKYERITISFTEADKDIVEYLKQLKKANKASEFVREAIREKIEGENQQNKIVEDEIRKAIENYLSKQNLRETPRSMNNNSINSNTNYSKNIGVDDAILNAIDSFEF